jgi:hypothetical protein
MKKLLYMFVASLLLFTSCEKDIKEIKEYFVPVYKNLYLVGSASPVGWNINEPAPMTVDAEKVYMFTWEGDLTPGEFKVPTTTGNWGCDYIMPVINGESDLSKTTAEVVKGGSPDKKWAITDATAGKYRITISIEDLDNPTIKFEKL